MRNLLKLIPALLFVLVLSLCSRAEAQLISTGSGILGSGTGPIGTGAPAGGGGGPSITGTSGVWTDVTPGWAVLSDGSCDSYGSQSVQKDPTQLGRYYAQINCSGIGRSDDYGLTWTKVNTGTNGAAVTDCAGNMAVAPNGKLYLGCLRGTLGLGLWSSTNGGVDWTHLTVTGSPGGRQDIYGPEVDPYDSQHIIFAGHEFDQIFESFDGGATMSSPTLAGGMIVGGGTAFVSFINTGNAGTTADRWLFRAQATDAHGAWLTTNGGTSWSRVEGFEHPHGSSQIWQPDTSGVVYAAGQYGDSGDGVYRSTNYGSTWTQVSPDAQQGIVWGTSTKMYSMWGWACGCGFIDSWWLVANQPGTGTWTHVTPANNAALSAGGGAAQAATGNDGTREVSILAMWKAGIWRYVD